MHDANMIANRILDLADAAGDTVTPMQLLKLVYISHGWMLGLYGVPLITDRIEAWKYGPVIPRVYHEVKGYRDQPVTGRLSVRVGQDDLLPIEEQVLRQTYDHYGSMSGIKLSSLTHKPGTPWAETWTEGCMGTVISNDLIEEYYTRLAVERAGA